MERPFAARRALIHPLWLGSLALLAVNDHVLKGAGLLPGTLTGKLSDFAGLVVAPALLAALLRLSSRRGLLLAHVATAVVFSAINLSPAVARAFEALTNLTPFPWRITVDPTDLLALPALVLAWRVLVPAMQRPLPERPMAQRAAVAFGSLACAATSQEPGPPGVPCADEFCGQVPRENAALVLGNATEDTRLVRLRPLKDSVAVDCPTLLADPESALSRELFAPAEAWLLAPNRGLPLKNNLLSPCVAYLVDADGLAPTVLAWSADTFAETLLSTATSSPDEGRTIPLTLDSNGKLSVGAHPAVFKAPPLEDPPVAPGCASPPETVGIEWSTPVPVGGPYLVASVESSPDDCHAITLQNKSTMYVCLPQAALPIKAGDSIEIAEVEPGVSSTESAGEAPEGQGLLIRSATYTILAMRGNVLARYELTGSPEPLSEPTIEGDLAQGCAGTHDVCGSLLIPLEVSYLGDHVPSISFLRAGKSLSLADGYGTLHLVRAEAMPIRDTACPPFARSSRHYESVLVVPAGP